MKAEQGDTKRVNTSNEKSIFMLHYAICYIRIFRVLLVSRFNFWNTRWHWLWNGSMYGEKTWKKNRENETRKNRKTQINSSYATMPDKLHHARTDPELYTSFLQSQSRGRFNAIFLFITYSGRLLTQICSENSSVIYMNIVFWIISPTLFFVPKQRKPLNTPSILFSPYNSSSPTTNPRFLK